jgi:ArsR family transcriptional regulator, arsenate/arsenite/antimonite-responsive transcriptional repressor
MDESRALAALTALAHETRLALIRSLIASGPEGLAQGELARRLTSSASRLAFHLGLLEQAGLVTSRRDGRNVLYAADTRNLGVLLGFILNDCCCAHPEVVRCCTHGRCQ